MQFLLFWQQNVSWCRLFTLYWVSERVPWSYCPVEYSGNTLAFEIPWPLLGCVTFSVLSSWIPPQWAQVTGTAHCSPFAQQNWSGWASLQMGQWWGGPGLPCFIMPSSGVNWEYGNEFNKTSTDFCFVLRRKALCRPRSPFCAACPFPELSAVVALCSLFWPAETPTWSCWWCLCFQAWCGHLLCTFTCDAMPCSFPKKKKEKLFCFVRAGNVDLSRNNR